MKDFVKVTQEDCKAIFVKWNEQSEAGGWDENPFDPDAQAEHFMLLANERINQVADQAVSRSDR